MNHFKPYFIILLSLLFAVLCGYYLFELFTQNQEKTFWNYFRPIVYFGSMSVMIFEWRKLRRNNKNS